jgi:hypothetical protein
MTIEKEVVSFVDRITEDGQLHLKTVTRVLEDGVQIGTDAIHRQVLAPGDAVGHLPERVQRLAAAEWTPDVVKAELLRREQLTLTTDLGDKESAAISPATS